ncbi:MAG: 16S rRNA (guanine(527)-N(7))-methyltransferase RsmG [Armatimonadota bacterium]|nr:16S rRNA (guanine(527)-N(7))-methyltransferase RsmG [Armatimonadota bacterium]
MDRFDRYLAALVRWRSRLNLVDASGEDELVDRHLLDSLLPLAAVELAAGASVVDIGSGAGLPGVPMKIARPDLRVTLIEASRRRVAFLEYLRDTLDLDDLVVRWGRAEDLARQADHRERYDCAVERATARLAAAIELCAPFVAICGWCVLLKGPSAAEQLSAAAGLVRKLGLQIMMSNNQLISRVGHTVLITAHKASATPSIYPRRTPRLGRPIHGA